MGSAEEDTAGGGGEGGEMREASARGSHTLSHAEGQTSPWLCWNTS